MEDKLVLFQHENDYDAFIEKALANYNELNKTKVSLSQIKGLVAMETQFDTTEKNIQKIIDRFFDLFKRYEYKGLQKVYASWKSGKLNYRNAKYKLFANQLYIDTVYAYVNFYFARDILKDEDKAKLDKAKVEKLEFRMRLINGGLVALILVVIMTIIFFITRVGK